MESTNNTTGTQLIELNRLLILLINTGYEIHQLMHNWEIDCGGCDNDCKNCKIDKNAVDLLKYSPIKKDIFVCIHRLSEIKAVLDLTSEIDTQKKYMLIMGRFKNLLDEEILKDDQRENQ